MRHENSIGRNSHAVRASDIPRFGRNLLHIQLRSAAMAALRAYPTTHSHEKVFSYALAQLSYILLEPWLPSP